MKWEPLGSAKKEARAKSPALFSLAPSPDVLFNNDDGVESPLVIRDGIRVFGVRAPSAVNHELVLVFTRREINRRRVDALPCLVRHFLGGWIPLIEATRHIYGLALIGMNRKSYGRFLSRLRLWARARFRSLLNDDLLGRAFFRAFYLHFALFLRLIPDVRTFCRKMLYI